MTSNPLISITHDLYLTRIIGHLINNKVWGLNPLPSYTSKCSAAAAVYIVSLCCWDTAEMESELFCALKVKGDMCQALHHGVHVKTDK